MNTVYTYIKTLFVRRLNRQNKQGELPAENIEFSSKWIFLVFQSLEPLFHEIFEPTASF